MSTEQNKSAEKNNASRNARVRGWRLLAVSAILVIGSLIFSVSAHGKSYQQSKIIGTEINSVKAQISDVEAGTKDGDLDSLKHNLSSLQDEKLRLERPYSFGMTAVFLAFALLLKGLYNAVIGVHPAEQADAKKIAMAGLMAALCYVGFAFFKIDIPVGTDKTAFHLGNVFCVLAALFLGGYLGGLAGAIGMTIGDLTTAYVTSAPKTFILKLTLPAVTG